jgi:putative proteasome-type protease
MLRQCPSGQSHKDRMRNQPPADRRSVLLPALLATQCQHHREDQQDKRLLHEPVRGLLTEGLRHEETGEAETLQTIPTLFQAALLIGRAIRQVGTMDQAALEQANLRFDVTFLFGGQIAGGPMELYLVYSAGNFIRCGSDAPYLQIGEHKYGKPILDRAVRYNTDLYEALKISPISMDSTMRSNIGVGPAIDLAIARRDAFAFEVLHRIEPGEPYFHDLSERWSVALRAAHKSIPQPPYGRDSS